MSGVVMKYVGGVLLAGLGIGVTKLLSSVNVIDPTEEDREFGIRYPGIAKQRDLMYGLNILYDYRVYLSPGLYNTIVEACNRAGESYAYFVRERHNMSENRLLSFPKYISFLCGNVDDLADTISLELIRERPDMEKEVSGAINAIKKVTTNFMFNCQQEVDSIMMK